MFGIQPHARESDESRRTLTDALFQRYAPAIFAFLLQQTTSREDAEDILLEVFSAALEYRQLGQFTEDQQRLWLWRIARNKLIDAYRRSVRRPSVSVDNVMNDLFADADQAPEYALLRWEEYTELHSALQTLPLLQQRILKLRFVNGLRSSEIATLVGKSDTAVRAILSRTMNQLRQLYREGKK